MDLDEAVDREVGRLRSDQGTRAVAVVGSYARDPSGDHNDVDVLVVPDENISTTDKRFVGDTLFEISYHSEEWFEWLLESEYWWFNYWWVTNADVRYDPEGLFEQFRERAESVRESRLSADGHEWLRSQLWDWQRDLESVSGPQKRYLLDQFFDFLVKEYYGLQSAIPVKANYRIDRLAEVDEEMHALAVAYLEAGTLADEERHVQAMLDEVVAVVGEPDPIVDVGVDEFEDHYWDLPGWILRLGVIGE